MKQVRISELKSRLSEHLRAAENGETIEVLDRKRAIVRLVPAAAVDSDSVEVIPARHSFKSVRALRPARATPRVDSLDALRQERGDH